MNTNIKTGVELIAAERERQILKEGWGAEHDDEHAGGQLSDAAACYALLAAVEARGSLEDFHVEQVRDGYDSCVTWPFEDEWLKPYGGQIANLVKAGALIAAEIERVQRMEAQGRPAEAGTTNGGG